MVFAVLNELFLDLDMYQEDPRIRAAATGCIDESQLAERVRRTLSRLDDLFS